MAGSGLFVVEFELMAERETLAKLVRKYADQPMSLADACLVRMAELRRGATVFTLDAQFGIYRQHARRRIATIRP